MDKKIKFNTIFQYILMLFIMLLSGSAFVAAGYYLSYLLVGVLFLIMFICYVRNIKITIDTIFYYVIIFAVMFIFSLLFHNRTENLNKMIGNILLVIFPFILIKLISWENFKKTYLKFMIVLALLSILCYYFFNDLIIKYGIHIQNGDMNKSIEYYSIIFYSYSPQIVRNSGFFWEPGVFTTALVFSIILINQYKMTFKIVVSNAILLVALISTQSTAALILAVLSYFYLFTVFIKKKNYSLMMIISLILLALIIICFVFLDNIIYGLHLQDIPLFEKLLKINLFSNPRVIALEVNLKSFWNNFFIGTGFQNGINLFQHLDSYDTATMANVMSIYGILGLSYNIFILRGIVKIKNISRLSKAVFCFIVLFIFNKEGQLSNLFCWILIFYLNTGLDFSRGVQVEYSEHLSFEVGHNSIVKK